MFILTTLYMAQIIFLKINTKINLLEEVLISSLLEESDLLRAGSTNFKSDGK